MIIPCPNCPWKDPIVESKGFKSYFTWAPKALIYQVRCLKCKWEGTISIPCEVTKLRGLEEE